jgi:hypothetical protein
MLVFRCTLCNKPLVRPEEYQPDIAWVAGGIDVGPQHAPDCTSSMKEEDLFDTDSPPTEIGAQGVHEGRRYIVTAEPRLVKTIVTNHWTVIGVWLDPCNDCGAPFLDYVSDGSIEFSVCTSCGAERQLVSDEDELEAEEPEWVQQDRDWVEGKPWPR